jgi:hypothetical protein
MESSEHRFTTNSIAAPPIFYWAAATFSIQSNQFIGVNLCRKLTLLAAHRGCQAACACSVSFKALRTFKIVSKLPEKLRFFGQCKCLHLRAQPDSVRTQSSDAVRHAACQALLAGFEQDAYAAGYL